MRTMTSFYPNCSSVTFFHSTGHFYRRALSLRVEAARRRRHHALIKEIVATLESHIRQPTRDKQELLERIRVRARPLPLRVGSEG